MKQKKTYLYPHLRRVQMWERVSMMVTSVNHSDTSGAKGVTMQNWTNGGSTTLAIEW